MHHSEYANKMYISFSVVISQCSPNAFEHNSENVSLPVNEEHKWNVQVENLKPGNQQVGILVLLIRYLSTAYVHVVVHIERARIHLEPSTLGPP